MNDVHRIQLYIIIH